jgi:hypothetical protein
VDANFAIWPVDWQSQSAQGVTDFYVDANLAIVPVDWQLELDQGFTEFYVDPTLSLSNHSTGN